MTSKSVWLALLLTVSLPAFSDTSPVAWWKFDEGSGTTAADASGNGNAATLVSPSWTTGKIGSGALTFGGTKLGTASGSGSLANLYLTGMTVSAWIKPTNSTSGRIVDKDNNDAGWFFGTTNASQINFTSDQDTSGVTALTSSTSIASITLNSWQHVLVTWDGTAGSSHVHLYINGVQADGSGTSGTGPEVSDSTTPLSIGNRQVDSARPFTGSMDDVRIYNRVLSTTEIQALADATAPGAPSGLTATAASGTQITLSWTAATDNIAVTGYLVERCQGASCSTFAQIGTPTTNSYSDTGLTASTSYSYRVRATDAAGNLSTYTSTASATTTAGGGDTQAPTAPSGLTATAASSSAVNLSWTASTDNVGVTGYRVERCQGASCTTFAQIGTPTTTSYGDTGLTASTSYSYRIRATDAAGNLSSYSSTASATTQSLADTTAPTAPSGLTATVVSSSQINLNWTAAADNVGVTSYKLERCQGASCTTFAQIGTPTTTTYSDTGLTASTSFSYRVRATDAAGNLGSYSNSSSATTTPGSGSGPLAWWKFDEGSGTAAADASGNGNAATLVSPSWTTGKIGSGALTFGGTKLGTASGSGSLANLYLTGMTVSAWIKPTNSTSGRIVDKDNNDAGWFFGTTNASQINFTSDQDTSGVTALTSSTSIASITLNTWQHVLATWDGTAGSSHVHLYINGVNADGSGTSGIGPEVSDSTTPLSIGNRQVDSARPFTGSIDDVRIYNRVLSTTEIQALADATAPGAPSGLTATAASGTQINLSWTAATDNIAVTGYLVERCQGASCSTFAQIGTPTTNSYSDTGLTASTSYSYRVRATDAAGNLSGYTSTASATTTPGGGDTQAPTAPSGLTATAASSSAVNLSWTASADNVGVTGYRVERCQGASCTTFAQIGTATTTSYSDTGLTASTSYSYRVRATDAAGNLSSYSSTASATTPSNSDTSPPSAPTGLTATAAGANQIDLHWTASTDNVGVTGYQLWMCQGAGCTNFSQVGAPTATIFSAAGLLPSTVYRFEVLAKDAAGNASGFSSVVTATTAAGGICD